MKINFRDIVSEEEKAGSLPAAIAKLPIYGWGALTMAGIPAGFAWHHLDKRTQTMDTDEEKRRERIRYYRALADQHASVKLEGQSR